MRTARPPPLPHSGRGPYGRVPVHRGLVQPPPPPLRPRLSVANQLRKESLLKAVIRKPSAVHRNGVTPDGQNHFYTRSWSIKGRWCSADERISRQGSRTLEDE